MRDLRVQMESDKKPDIWTYLLFVFYKDLHFFSDLGMIFQEKSGVKVPSPPQNGVTKGKSSVFEAFFAKNAHSIASLNCSKLTKQI